MQCQSAAGLGSQNHTQHSQAGDVQGALSFMLASAAFVPPGNANHHLVAFLIKEGLKTRCNGKDFSFTEEAHLKKKKYKPSCTKPSGLLIIDGPESELHLSKPFWVC